MAFRFTAILAEDETTLALRVAAVHPRIHGVLLFGDRCTRKSTAALAQLLPRMRAVASPATAPPQGSN